jgi:hypothetical protein
LFPVKPATDHWAQQRIWRRVRLRLSLPVTARRLAPGLAGARVQLHFE